MSGLEIVAAIPADGVGASRTGAIDQRGHLLTVQVEHVQLYILILREREGDHRAAVERIRVVRLQAEVLWCGTVTALRYGRRHCGCVGCQQAQAVQEEGAFQAATEPQLVEIGARVEQILQRDDDLLPGIVGQIDDETFRPPPTRAIDLEPPVPSRRWDNCMRKGCSNSSTALAKAAVRRNMSTVKGLAEAQRQSRAGTKGRLNLYSGSGTVPSSPVKLGAKNATRFMTMMARPSRYGGYVNALNIAWTTVILPGGPAT